MVLDSDFLTQVQTRLSAPDSRFRTVTHPDFVHPSFGGQLPRFLVGLHHPRNLSKTVWVFHQAFFHLGIILLRDHPCNTL